jgi:hypothetical protein
MAYMAQVQVTRQKDICARRDQCAQRLPVGRRNRQTRGARHWRIEGVMTHDDFHELSRQLLEKSDQSGDITGREATVFEGKGSRCICADKGDL